MELTKIKELVIEKSGETLKKAEPTPIIRGLVSFLGSFLLMNPFVAGKFSPFAISLICISSSANSFFAAAGAVIGSFFFFDGTDSVKYCAAALLCVLTKSVCERYLISDLDEIVTYINAFAGLFLIGSAIICATGFDFDAILTVLYESVLCCAGAYLFYNSFSLIWGKKDLSRFTTSDIITVLLSVGIALMPFYKYKLLVFSPVTMLFSLCILIFSRLRNSGGGALCGICLGTAAGLSSEIGLMSIGYALGGMLGGELSRKGKPWCAVGFIIPIAVCAFSDGTLSSYMAIFESAVACGMFLAIPDRFFDTVSSKLNVTAATYIKSDNAVALSEKLHAASDAFSEVSSCVNAVQNTLNPLTQTQLNQVLTNAWCKVCSECELKESCRNEVKIPNVEDIEKIAQALSNHAELDETRFPKGFYSACYCFSEMRSELYDRYLSFVASLGAQGKVNQIQGLMCEQFKSMADILDDLARDFDDETNSRTEIGEICCAEALESGLNVLNTECHLDKLGRATVAITVTPPRADFNITQFTHNLSTAIGKKLDTPELAQNDGSCTLSFKQAADFNVSIGALSRASDESGICGDYYRSFRDRNDRYIILLSDGMGTGSRAAVDSAMAAELFSKLIKSGLSFDSALPIANSALLVKSADESLATLDVVSIDLYTGKADFMKAGAAATFVRHKDSVAQLEQASLPIGILRDIRFAKATATLTKGDIVLMVSDGILGDCNTWIQHELKEWDTDKTPDELAHFILNSATQRKLGKPLDDMTVIAVYIN